MTTFKIYIGMILLNTTIAMDKEEVLRIFTPYVKKIYGQEGIDMLRVVETN